MYNEYVAHVRTAAVAESSGTQSQSSTHLNSNYQPGKFVTVSLRDSVSFCPFSSKYFLNGVSSVMEWLDIEDQVCVPITGDMIFGSGKY